MLTDYSTLTEEKLEKMDKRAVIAIAMSMKGQLTTISNQLNIITEQLALMNQRSFGRKTERADQIDNQMSLFELYDIFNEPEILSDDSPEPEIEKVIISGYTRKAKTKREDKLEGLPARIFEHKLSEDELSELFPDGYKELPPEVYKRLSVIPRTFIVDEHHVHLYASKNNDGRIVRAERPADIFRTSPATSSLMSMITVSKYANHMPLERQSKEMAQEGVKLETNTLANWMINGAQTYLSILYEELHKWIYKSLVIHADETNFEIILDGRPAGSKSWMWVYRNGKCDADHPIILYDYQPTRRTDHPDEFLKDYNGILVTDGYQVYHSLEKKREGLMVAGCWVHAKRKFAEFVKALGANGLEGTIAAEASKRISKITHLDNKLDDLSKEERDKQRQLIIKPRVDKFFAWAKEAIKQLPEGSDTANGLQYCINQEEYLRVFLSDGNVPMDNNLAEQAIRPFTIGRKNWVTMTSTDGAGASAIIYSLVETAKANNLRLFDYFEYLYSELAAHANDTKRDFIQDLLPWSDIVQEKFSIPSKS